MPRPARERSRNSPVSATQYEEPQNPEMRIDTQSLSPDLAAHRILVKLEGLGYIR